MNKRKKKKNNKNAGPGAIAALLLLTAAVVGLCVYFTGKDNNIKGETTPGITDKVVTPEITGGTPVFIPTPSPTPALADSVARLRVAENADVIFVVAGDGSQAGCDFYAFYKENEQWKLGLTSTGYLGSNGINYDNRSEGDRTTPGGLFPLGMCFGIADNPGGLQKSYYKVTSDDYWDGDVNSDTYNQLVKASEMPASWNSAASEHLMDYQEQYQYVVNIEFNTDPVVKGRGSAIFLHCTRAGGTVTAGCVAIPKADLLQAMRMLRGEAYILIVKDLNDMQNYFTDK